MRSEGLETALAEMLDNIAFAESVVMDMSRDAFAASRLHFYAATRALEIISEASRKLPDALRERHPLIPWRAIRDAGNIYRHRYDLVDEWLVWDTVQKHLPPLRAAVEAELALLSMRTGR